MTRNLGAYPAQLLNPYNFKILAFLLHGYHTPQGSSSPLTNITLSFLQTSLLNLETVQVPPNSPLIYWFFLPPLPLRLDFLVNSHNAIFHTCSHLLKVTKFLVKISQFKLLVVTEKNIFVYKCFAIKYFRFQFISYVKTASP